jgi:hypothetical protein
MSSSSAVFVPHLFRARLATQRACQTVALVVMLLGSLQAENPGALVPDGKTGLFVPLRYENGKIVPDAARVTLHRPTPAAQADLPRLLAFIVERIEALGPVCRWNEGINELNPDVRAVENVSGTWAEGNAVFQTWLDELKGDDDWGDFRNWSTDAAGAVLAGQANQTGPFVKVEETTPLSLLNTDSFDIGTTGTLVFSVTGPITDADVAAAFQPLNPSAAPLARQLQRSLSRQVGRLWWNADVVAAAQDHLRLFQIEASSGISPTGFYLKAHALSRQVEVLGPMPVTSLVVVGAPDSATAAARLRLGAYNLLSTPYQRVLHASRVQPEPDGVTPGTYSLSLKEAGLPPPNEPEFVLGPDAVARSAARLAELGLDQEIRASDTVQVAFVIPTPQSDSEEPAKQKPPVKTPAERRNDFVLRAGAGPSTDYAAGVLYRLKQIAGSNALTVSAGTTEHLPNGGASYQWDYLGFATLGRRLSTSLEVGRHTATNRLVADAAATEKDDRYAFAGALEIWRDLRGHWLNVDLAVADERTRLEGTDAAPSGIDLDSHATTTVLRIVYSHSGRGGGLPWTDLNGEFGGGWNRGRDTGSYQWTRWTATHRRTLFDSIRWEERAYLHLSTGDVPLARLPSFGGEDSVRGFRRDAARGRGAWAVQNELWFRLPENLPLPEKIAVPLHRSLSVAAFVDVGGVTRPVEHDAGFATSAGLGLRFVRGPLTVRADWAHTVGGAATLRGGSAAYFSLQVRPQF